MYLTLHSEQYKMHNAYFTLRAHYTLYTATYWAGSVSVEICGDSGLWYSVFSTPGRSYTYTYTVTLTPGRSYTYTYTYTYTYYGVIPHTVTDQSF